MLAAVLLIFVPTALLAQAKLQPRNHEGERDYRYAFFFDVSGSMNESGKLRGANSPTRQYLVEHLFANPEIFHEGQPASVYSFTTVCRHLFSGSLHRAAIQNMLLTDLPVTHENTDLVETMRTAQQEHQRQGNNGVTLVWILTDNVNDPAGHGADDENTRAFYGEMFREEASAQRMYFFPLKDYKLVFYLLVFAPDASLQGMDIDTFEDELTRFARALGAPKIRAKPVGGERPLELAGINSTDQRVLSEVIGSGTRSSLRITGLKEGQPLNAHFRVHIHSRFDEWRVEDANVEVVSLQDLRSDDFPNIGRKMPARMSPHDVTVDPHSQTGKVYSLDLGDESQDAPQAPFFTLAALNPDAHGVITGKLVVKIGDPKLTLKIFNDPATTAAIQSVFRLKDIEYFVPKSAAGQAMRLDLIIPVEFEVGYSSLPRWAALGVVLIVLVGGTILILAAKGKALECRLVGYQEDTFKLAPGTAFPIMNHGTPIAVLRKPMFGGIICGPMAGVTLNGRPVAARIGNGAPIELAHEGNTRSYRLEVLSRRRSPMNKPQAQTPSGQFY